MNQTWNFQNTYTSLPQKLFSFQDPVPGLEPKLVLFNDALAADLGLSSLDANAEETAAIFAGNLLPEGAKPLAQAYAGHQFGHFNILGDGRAVLLGEQITPQNERFDIQLKGAGQTPYSRRGDGRATFSSMLREYLMSEAMHHLGIPTTRSLAVAKTGLPVYREKINEGAVLTRIAASHIRVGTFQFIRQFGTEEELQAFLDYTIDRHYPALKNEENKALALLKAVMDKQIDLMVHWIRVGFIHGVMNTDNMSIAGETIDYGPCAFLNIYDPKTVFSSIDQNGRYAFGNQALIARWNLAVFAGSLMPLIDSDEEKALALAQYAIDQFHPLFMEKWYAMMYQKLGITKPQEEDKTLVNEILELLEIHKVDYTNFFYHLRFGTKGKATIYSDDTFSKWYKKWEKRQSGAASYAMMDTNNPILIPRNHLVEEALDAYVKGDASVFNDLLEQLQQPYYNEQRETIPQLVPADFDTCYQTFCGT
ncbi:MAG: YdiU family protein [Saprospiraceae bacterium]|nr:YdiU family protein [Saprospiraceae bacterium]